MTLAVLMQTAAQVAVAYGAQDLSLILFWCEVGVSVLRLLDRFISESGCEVGIATLFSFFCAALRS